MHFHAFSEAIRKCTAGFYNLPEHQLFTDLTSVSLPMEMVQGELQNKATQEDANPNQFHSVCLPQQRTAREKPLVFFSKLEISIVSPENGELFFCWKLRVHNIQNFRFKNCVPEAEETSDKGADDDNGNFSNLFRHRGSVSGEQQL